MTQRYIQIPIGSGQSVFSLTNKELFQETLQSLGLLVMADGLLFP